MQTRFEASTDPLAKFKDGACDRTSGRPIPLVNTAIDARVLGGLAIVRTERTFRNAEPHSIEATITFPVPIHATMVALTAAIDGRTLTGRAQRRPCADADRAGYPPARGAGAAARSRPA